MITDHSHLADHTRRLPLFDGCNLPSQRPTEDPLEARRRAEAAAFEKANAAWKSAYRDFILKYLEWNGPSTAEQIRIGYEKSFLPQQTGSKRASGAIFRSLMNEGLIRKCGRETSKLYGNELVRYELARETYETR